MGPLCSVQHAPAVAEGPLRLSVGLTADVGAGAGAVAHRRRLLFF